MKTQKINKTSQISDENMEERPLSRWALVVSWAILFGLSWTALLALCEGVLFILR
jgi:hypothetical protein